MIDLIIFTMLISLLCNCTDIQEKTVFKDSIDVYPIIDIYNESRKDCMERVREASLGSAEYVKCRGLESSYKEHISVVFDLNSSIMQEKLGRLEYKANHDVTYNKIQLNEDHYDLHRNEIYEQERDINRGFKIFDELRENDDYEYIYYCFNNTDKDTMKLVNCLGSVDKY